MIKESITATKIAQREILNINMFRQQILHWKVNQRETGKRIGITWFEEWEKVCLFEMNEISMATNKGRYFKAELIVPRWPDWNNNKWDE